MKRVTLLLSVLALFAATAFAQTTVTFQVTDADSQAWALAPYSVYLSSVFANTPQPTATQTGTLNATGGASFSLAAGTYTFKACATAASYSLGVVGNQQPFCTSSSVAVSGGSQTVTLTPAAIRITPAIGLSIQAYADAEISTPYAGLRYYNLIALVPRVYSGTAWFDDGIAPAAAFSTLPACAAGTEGMMRSITDGSVNTWGTTVAGSGSNHVLARCNGTNWTVVGK